MLLLGSKGVPMLHIEELTISEASTMEDYCRRALGADVTELKKLVVRHCSRHFESRQFVRGQIVHAETGRSVALVVRSGTLRVVQFIDGTLRQLDMLKAGGHLLEYVEKESDLKSVSVICASSHADVRTIMTNML